VRTADGAYNPLIPYLATVMCCPSCGADAFLPASDHVVCGSCQATFTDPESVLDTAPGVRPRRVAPWVPQGAPGAWEDEVLPDCWSRLGSVDRETLEAFATAWFRPSGQGPVLDLHTGHGWMARRLARWVGVARVLGIDESLSVLRATQASPRDPGMAWIRADLTRLPFLDGRVAGAVCFGDPGPGTWTRAVLGEWARVLSADGRLVGMAQVRGEGWAAIRDGVRAALGRDVPPDPAHLQATIEGEGLEILAWNQFGELALFAARRRPS